MNRFSIIKKLLLTALLLLAANGSLIAQDAAFLERGTSAIHPGGQRSPSASALAGIDSDTFHDGPTLTCAMCHVMHASQQHPHDDQTQPDPFGAYPQQFLPTEKLLKAPDPVTLCLACHDNVSGVPDVVGIDVNGLTERSAGMFDDPGADNASGHDLETGLATGPGFDLCIRCHFGGTFETAAVSCIDCHNPHGNGRSRNLQWASNPGGEPQFGLFTNSGASGIARYEASNIGYGTTDDDLVREVSNMCLDCHHIFSGAQYIDPDGDGIHNRHPTYDSERSSPNHISQGDADASTDGAHWEDGTGAGFLSTARLRFVVAGATDFTSTQTVDASTNGVFCLSCHKAHGGNHSFGLLWDPSAGVNGEGCDQCHNKTAQ